MKRGYDAPSGVESRPQRAGREHSINKRTAYLTAVYLVSLVDAFSE
jgi:hypothetical protein